MKIHIRSKNTFSSHWYFKKLRNDPSIGWINQWFSKQIWISLLRTFSALRYIAVVYCFQRTYYSGHQKSYNVTLKTQRHTSVYVRTKAFRPRSPTSRSPSPEKRTNLCAKSFLKQGQQPSTQLLPICSPHYLSPKPPPAHTRLRSPLRQINECFLMVVLTGNLLTSLSPGPARAASIICVVSCPLQAP